MVDLFQYIGLYTAIEMSGDSCSIKWDLLQSDMGSWIMHCLFFSQAMMLDNLVTYTLGGAVKTSSQL